MMSEKCFIYLTIVMTVVTQLHAACVCNEKGSDYCAGCSEPLVVRPKHKYSDGYPKIDLPPIGDTCSCSKVMIEPASLPKPCSKHKKPTCGCKKSEYSSSYSSSYSPPSSYDSPPPPIFSTAYQPPSSYAVPHANYVPTAPKDDSLPADPISVSLAIQAGKAIEVPEAKLAYGFVQKPIDGLPKVYMSSVLEENLYALKNDVITLKKPLPAKSHKKQPEEYPDAEEEEAHAAEKDAAEEGEHPSLTYKQLGYETEQFKNPQFQEVRSAYSYSPAYAPPAYAPPAYAPPAVVPGKVSVDCGYKPGRIAKYKGHKHY